MKAGWEIWPFKKGKSFHKGPTTKAAVKKRELMILLACFAGATLLHVAGIIGHQSPMKELVTQIHVILLLTVIFYGIVVLLRVIYSLISHFWIR